MEAYAGIARGTGLMEWYLSGIEAPYASTFSSISPSAPQLVQPPHSIVNAGDREYLVFNRAAPSGCSESTRIRLDFAQSEASLVSNYSSPNTQCLMVNFLGQSHLMDGEHTLVVWSDKGQVDVLDANGSSIWQVQAGLGAAFAFSDWSAGFGGL
jgi:hypothetical protein